MGTVVGLGVGLVLGSLVGVLVGRGEGPTEGACIRVSHHEAGESGLETQRDQVKNQGRFSVALAAVCAPLPSKPTPDPAHPCIETATDGADTDAMNGSAKD